MLSYQRQTSSVDADSLWAHEPYGSPWAGRDFPGVATLLCVGSHGR